MRTVTFERSKDSAIKGAGNKSPKYHYTHTHSLMLTCIREYTYIPCGGLLKKIPSFLIPLFNDNDAALVKAKGITYKNLFVLQSKSRRAYALIQPFRPAT